MEEIAKSVNVRWKKSLLLFKKKYHSIKLYRINWKKHCDLRSLNAIQNQLDEPEWISCDTIILHLALGAHE